MVHYEHRQALVVVIDERDVPMRWPAGDEAGQRTFLEFKTKGRLEHHLGNLPLEGMSCNRDARPGTDSYKRRRCRIGRA